MNLLQYLLFEIPQPHSRIAKGRESIFRFAHLPLDRLQDSVDLLRNDRQVMSQGDDLQANGFKKFLRLEDVRRICARVGIRKITASTKVAAMIMKMMISAMDSGLPSNSA